VPRPGSSARDEVIGCQRDHPAHGTTQRTDRRRASQLVRQTRALRSQEEGGAADVGLEGYRAVVDALDVREGETCWCTETAGVGNWRGRSRGCGASVIGTASGSNHDYLRSLGFEPVPTATLEEGYGAGPVGVDARLEPQTADRAAPLAITKTPRAPPTSRAPRSPNETKTTGPSRSSPA